MIPTGRELGVLLVCVLLCSACAAPVNTPQSTLPRCSDGRPQSEIAAQKRLPLEPRDPAILCVRIAESGSRVYGLRDGRAVSLYEREGGLPSKPGAKVADESGMRTIASQTWDWARYDGTVVLRTTMPDSLYVEFAMNSTGDTRLVVDELARLASTLRP